MPPRGVRKGSKRERQYKHIKESEKKAGRSNERRSLGLLGIRERIEALGGNVKWVSPAGKGTRVRVRIPLVRKGGTHEEDTDRR